MVYQWSALWVLAGDASLFEFCGRNDYKPLIYALDFLGKGDLSGAFMSHARLPLHPPTPSSVSFERESSLGSPGGGTGDCGDSADEAGPMA